MGILWPEHGKTKAGDRSILVIGSSLGVERDTSPAAAWLTYRWWVSSPASQPPAPIAQRTNSYKMDFASSSSSCSSSSPPSPPTHPNVLTADRENKPINELIHLLTFYFCLFPLQLKLLQCFSHMYNEGKKTNSALLCYIYIFQLLVLLHWSSPSERDWAKSKTEKNKVNSFFCFKFSVQQQPTVVHLCQVEDEHAYRGFVGEKIPFEKMEKRKKKRTTKADQYTPIFVVWLLLRCSGLY